MWAMPLLTNSGVPITILASGISVDSEDSTGNARFVKINHATVTTPRIISFWFYKHSGEGVSINNSSANSQVDPPGATTFYNLNFGVNTAGNPVFTIADFDAPQNSYVNLAWNDQDSTGEENPNIKEDAWNHIAFFVTNWTTGFGSTKSVRAYLNGVDQGTETDSGVSQRNASLRFTGYDYNAARLSGTFFGGDAADTVTIDDSTQHAAANQQRYCIAQFFVGYTDDSTDAYDIQDFYQDGSAVDLGDGTKGGTQQLIPSIYQLLNYPFPLVDSATQDGLVLYDDRTTLTANDPAFQCPNT